MQIPVKKIVKIGPVDTEIALLIVKKITRGLPVARIARDVGGSSTNRSSDIMHFLRRLHERL